MKLKYVGDQPLVSERGVSFDHSRPDKYIYLHAVLELLEALSYGPTETTKHLYKAQDKELSPDELLEKLHKYVPNLEEIEAQKHFKAEEFIEELKGGVEASTTFTPEEKEVFLKNIDLMEDYFLQYVTNKAVYDAALDALAKEIKEAKVQEVDVPMFRNYGVVLKDLQDVVENMKAPIDMEFEVIKTDEGLVGRARFKHS